MFNWEGLRAESAASNSPLTALLQAFYADQRSTLESNHTLSGLSSLSSRSGNSASGPTYGTEDWDFLTGSDQKDQLYGRGGSDFLSGAAGDDTLFGNQDSDLLWGGNGHDFLNGGEAADGLIGAAGDDTLIGGSGDDWLWGGRGQDTLKGGSGEDVLWGEAGQDRLDGGTGQDILNGGRGSDILIDSDGGDTLTGGQGTDEFWLGDGNLGATLITDFQIGRDRLKFLQMGLTFDDLTRIDSEAGAVIKFRDTELAVLAGVRAYQLTDENFIWGKTEAASGLQAAINTVLAATDLPGATVSVTAPDGTFWRGAGGVSDLSQDTQMQVADRFQIGSITKPMVATVVLQLMQEGRLTLEDTLTDWLPTSITDNLANSDRINIRQLLNHTSGIADFANPLQQALFADNSLGLEPRTNAEILTRYVYEQPPFSPPGETHYYSNTNYLLLGEIIETATDSTLADLLQARIFEPLGMKNSVFSPQAPVPGGYTRGYLDAESNGMPSLDVSALNPAFDGDGGHAGVVSTAEEVARFAQGLFTGELLAPETLKQMTTDLVPSDDDTFYGLGINWTPQGYTALFHGGSWLGWSSQMVYFPEQNTTVSIMTNMQSRLEPRPSNQMFEAIASSLIDNFQDDFVDAS
ncbi:MAG: serine hydrolase [Leptolyngbya sp. SIO1E4]|nr:serine hydrolase [Leptolyngbya sp. SIO1E4]